MSNTIYLYLKTHNVTGLQYLGKTVQDPFKYKGSGKVWLRHIKKHGYDVSTEILYETDDAVEFSEASQLYSKMLDVVESKRFANLCEESGQGGFTVYTEDRAEKIKHKLIGKPKSESHKKLISDSRKGIILAIDTITDEFVQIPKELFDNDRYVGAGVRNKGKKYSKRREYNRVNKISTCPHCNKQGASNNMTRYHFDNCKLKP